MYGSILKLILVYTFYISNFINTGEFMYGVWKGPYIFEWGNMKEASRKTTDGREKREKESSKRCRYLL